MEVASANSGEEQNQNAPLMPRSKTLPLSYERTKDGIKIFGDDECSRRLQSEDARLQRSERKLYWAYKFLVLLIVVVGLFYAHKPELSPLPMAIDWLRKQLSRIFTK